MRFFLIPFLSFALLTGIARADNSLDLAVQLAHNGAPQLAFARVERDQPIQANAPQWWQWETLRLSLLVELNRVADALQRAALLPAEIPAAYLAVYRPMAQAALRQNDPLLARAYLAKWLWGGELDEGQLKEARRLVIQSHLAQRRPDIAYLSMLRFRQDYPVPDEGETAQFVEQLLLVGGVAEAGNWLAQIDDASPLKLLLQLRANLVTPEAAIAAARAELEPPPTKPAEIRKDGKKTLKMARQLTTPDDKDIAAYWSIIAQAAEQRKTPELRAEALERQLNLLSSPDDGLFGVRAEALWRGYAGLALAEANRAQLLVGEDAAWLDLAIRSSTASPLRARALFAYLAKQGASAETRATAQMRLAALLIQGNLDVTASRLFADAEGAEALLLGLLPAGENTRRNEMLIALGQAAAARNEHAHAAEYFLSATGLKAQRLAADSLARAGLLEDARRQYDGMFK
jgi:hypothetical protein